MWLMVALICSNVNASEESVKKMYQGSLEKKLGYNCHDRSLKSLVKGADEIYIAKVVNEFLPIEVAPEKVRIKELVSNGMSQREAYAAREVELDRLRYKVYEFKIIEALKGGSQKSTVLYKLPLLKPLNEAKGVGSKQMLINKGSEKCWTYPKFEMGKKYLIFPNYFLHPKGNVEIERITPDELSEIKFLLKDG